MRKILAEIRNGSFARPGSKKMKRAAPTSSPRAKREQSQHPIEQLGPKLRAMMPFLQPVIAPGLENKAAASKK